MTILDGLGIVGGVAFAFGEVIFALKGKQKLSTFSYSLFAICSNNEYATIIVLSPMAIFFGYFADIKITEKK